MLQLTINNQFIPLDPGISIPFVLNNPMFNTKGSYSFTLTIPWSNEIAKALGYIDKPDKSGIPSQTFTGTLGYQGSNTWEIVGYPKKVTSKNVQLYFRIGLGGFFEIVKDKTLQDLELGGERTIDIITNNTDLQYPTSDYAIFPVENANFHDDTTTDLETEYKENIYYQNYPSGASALGEVITPFPYVGYIHEQIFNENGYPIEKNIFKLNDELKKLCEFNLHDITTLQKVGASSVFNHGKAYLKNHLPALSIQEYLNNIKNKYNIITFVNEFSKKVKLLLGEEIIKDPKCIDITNLCGENLTTIDETVYNDASIVSSVDSDDYYVQTYYKDMSEFRDRIKGSVGQFSDLDNLSPVSAGDIYLVNQGLGSFYELKVEWNEISFSNPIYSWEFLSMAAYQNYHSGFEEPKLQIENTIASIMWHAVGIDKRNPARLWRVALLGQKGNSIWRSDKVSFSQKHLLYHGLQKDSQDNDYPFGSFLNLNYENNTVGTLNLSYNDLIAEGDGIVSHWWKNWLNWQLNIARTFEGFINFPSYMIFNFPWEKKHRIRNTNYFIKQIKVNLKYNAPEVGVSQIVKI